MSGAGTTVELGRDAASQKAVLNILEDLTEEREQAAGVQRAVMNMLDDLTSERERAGEVHRSVLNILDDFAAERDRQASTHRAVLNILDDVDVEQRKVRSINAELTAEVAERVRTERALEERTRDLAESNAELEMFAYVASHDLAEPLRAIAGPVSLLAHRYRGALDAEADQLIGFAVDGCARMQVLIADLLSLSRVGRSGAPATDVDLDRLLCDLLESLERAHSGEGATVTHDPLPVVRGVATELNQVLQNLISNALKFTDPDRPARVHVAVERVEGGWRIAVVDNGIGVDQRHHERVFGMFKRLHTRDAFPGTGLGLALCKKIIENHGGAIGVESSPDHEGSTFWFTLLEGDRCTT